MAERSILYICEGPKDEPGFVHAFMKKAFANIEYRIKATASPWGYKELVQKTAISTRGDEDVTFSFP